MVTQPPNQSRPFVERRQSNLSKAYKERLSAEQENLKQAPDFYTRDSQKHLLNGETSTRYRAEFFDQVFLDVVSKLFETWLHSSPEEIKKREYLYQVAMSLGAVKQQLLAYEQLGKNIPNILGEEETQPTEGDTE